MEKRVSIVRRVICGSHPCMPWCATRRVTGKYPGSDCAAIVPSLVDKGVGERSETMFVNSEYIEKEHTCTWDQDINRILGT